MSALSLWHTAPHHSELRTTYLPPATNKQLIIKSLYIWLFLSGQSPLTKGHPLTGQWVHLLHPHQSKCVVDANSVFAIPKGVPPKRATLASNVETAVNAVWESHVSIGDKDST